MKARIATVLLAALVLCACGRSSAPGGAGSAPKGAAKYVASSKSNVFHLPSCRSAARISADNLISFASREEAEKAGYRPCQVCKP